MLATAKALLRRLTEPSPLVHDESERSRARLLAGVTLVIAPLGLISGLVQVAVNPEFLPAFAIIAAAVTVLGVAYLLSRSIHYRIAAWTVCVVPALGALGVGMYRPRDPVWFAFLLFSPLLGTLFLHARAVLGLVALDVVALLIWAAVRHTENPELAVSAAGFVIIGGFIVFASTVHRDKVERIRLETLEQSQRILAETRQLETVGRLAGGVAHDFNNILTVAMMNLALLTRGAPSQEAEDLQLALDRAAALVAQLLTLARRQNIERQNLDVCRVLSGIEQMLESLVAGQATLRFDGVGDGPIHVCADESQLEQIFVNLVTNARDAMPEGGDITVALSRLDLDSPPGDLPPGDYVRICVRDNGAGMDEATRTRVFEPFYTTKGSKGHGIGLATVQGSVLQNGGHISVDSAPGRGATFTVLLPAAPPPEATAGDDAPPRVRGEMAKESTTLLVVDDDASTRQAVVGMLRGCGWTVEAASSSDEALERLERDSPPPTIGLAIVDVMMPGTRGTELVKQITERWPEIACILISGLVDESAVTGPSGDRVLFLGKPFREEQLVTAIESALATAGRATTAAGRRSTSGTGTSSRR